MRVVFYLLVLIWFTSCTKDQGPVYNTDYVISDTISFSDDIQPIFNNNCTGCHNASHSKLKLVPGYSYNQLMYDGFNAPYIDTVLPTSSALYKYVTGENAIMPPTGGIPGNDINLIYNWIRQGAHNN